MLKESVETMIHVGKKAQTPRRTAVPGAFFFMIIITMMIMIIVMVITTIIIVSAYYEGARWHAPYERPRGESQVGHVHLRKRHRGDAEDHRQQHGRLHEQREAPAVVHLLGGPGRQHAKELARGASEASLGAR